MANTSSLVFAGVAPHPPIMVPEVGREASADVRQSIDAMADLTARVISSGAKTVVLISPHAPLESQAFVAYGGPELSGDFANFRAPATGVEATLDSDLLREISRAASHQNLSVERITGFDLDHGTAVPLYFLQRNGWHGNVVAFGFSFLSNPEHLRFGNCIRKAADELGRPVAFIASGDLSHRLKRDAPAGYHPDAHLFDEEIVEAIRSCATSRIVNINHEVRRRAGECGYRSLLVAIGAIQGLESNCEVISYEAPFGVGYLVAQLTAEGKEAVTTQPAHLASQANTQSAQAEISATTSRTQSVTISSPQPKIPALARRVIETFINTGSIIDPPSDLSELLSARAGCFVSIKTFAGDLRGCIGTIDPVKNTLAEEIIANAVSAATLDPRFTSVKPEELAHLKYSVDVLSVPEPATLADLDPKIYGLIVSDESGERRGLLLPNLDGINTTERQVELAMRKAGLSPEARVNLFRFRSERYSE